jgi:FkbM family methyltransferase
MDDVRSANTWISHYVCTEILKGRTYPPIEFVDGVQMIVDVGANVGASAVYFSRLYPRATVHACEPGAAAYALLRENTQDLPNVFTWQIGLHDHDGTGALYAGIDDGVTSSLVPSTFTSDSAETVELRSTRDWLDENNVERVDLLKVDTEGSEIPILRSFGDRLASVKVFYVEAHSDADRRKIDEMVASTHQLAYVSGGLADSRFHIRPRRLVRGRGTGRPLAAPHLQPKRGHAETRATAARAASPTSDLVGVNSGTRERSGSRVT